MDLWELCLKINMKYSAAVGEEEQRNCLRCRQFSGYIFCWVKVVRPKTVSKGGNLGYICLVFA